MAADVIGTFLGSIMLIAGLGKLLQGEGFRYTVTQYAQIFGWSTTARVWDLFARFLPWLQVFIGTAMLRGLLVRPCASLIALMLVVFVGIQARALRKGRRLGCGCFGLLMHGPVRPLTVARDSTLAILALVLAVISS